MPLTLSEILVLYIFPSLGTIFASAMFAAPIKSLSIALSKGTLGDLNPTPWAFMTGNCLGWVAYSFVTQNMFVLVSNLPGLILSVWLNVGAAKLQYLERYETLESTIARSDLSLRLEESNNEENHSTEDDFDVDTSNIVPRDNDEEIDLPVSTPHEHWVIGVLIGWGLTLASVVFIPMSNHERRDIIGIVVNLNLVVFYGAPLSTIIQVFKTKSSVSIHRRTLVMGILNAFFWLVYGLALMDMVIFLPNFCCFLLSIIQMILCLIFPRPSADVIDEGTRRNENLEVL